MSHVRPPEAVPLSLFWAETKESDHQHFSVDLEFLTAPQCAKHRVLFLLYEISLAAGLAAGDFTKTLSKTDVRRLRKALERGADAAQELRRSDLFALLPRQVAVHDSAYDLRQSADVLHLLEEGFDKRRAYRLDHVKAVFVRYVERRTGAPNDQQVVSLIDVAQAPDSSVWDEEEGGFVSRQIPAWEHYTLQQHSKWRADHKRLRARESVFEKELLRKADEEGERVAQWLKRNRPPEKS